MKATATVSSLPGGIRSRGGSYLVDVTLRGQRRTGTAPTVEEAKLLQSELRLALMRGVSKQVMEKVWTLGEAVEKTTRAVWKGTRGERTAVRNVDAAVEYFGAATALDKISSADITAYVEHLQDDGNSNATVNRKIAALSRVFTHAVENGGAKAKPVMRRKKEGVGRIRFLTASEEQTALALLSQWGKDEQAEAVCVLVDTGLRCSELWHLEVRDCDFEKRLIAVWATKADHPRSVPMTQRVHDILIRRCELVGAGKVFAFDNAWLRHAWERVRTVMKLDEDKQFVPHALRHTCASRLVQRGVTLKVVQEWLGHKGIQMTMRYAHLCPTNLLDAVKVLEL